MVPITFFSVMEYLLIIQQRVDFAQFLGNKELKIECKLLETPKAQQPLKHQRCESRNNVWDYSEVETELNSDNGQSAAKPERGGSETIITQSRKGLLYSPDHNDIRVGLGNQEW